MERSWSFSSRRTHFTTTARASRPCSLEQSAFLRNRCSKWTKPTQKQNGRSFHAISASLTPFKSFSRSVNLDDIRNLIKLFGHELGSKKKREHKQSAAGYKQVFFSHTNWKSHRSRVRCFYDLIGIMNLDAFRLLNPLVIMVTIISSLVVAWNCSVILEWLPAQFLLRMNPFPLAIIAAAFSFTFAFRTDASYARFDEAVKIWGRMVAIIREMARLASSYVRRGENQSVENEKLNRFLRYLRAFPLACKHHLVNEGSLERDLKNLHSLRSDEIAEIMNSFHRPNHIIYVLSECIQNFSIHPFQKISMDQNLTIFSDMIGDCERIFKTPVPLVFTQLISRFMVFWHVFLPLALWDACGVLTIPISFFISAFFFRLEEVGVFIEEPFTVICLQTIAAAANDDASATLSQRDKCRTEILASDVCTHTLKAVASDERIQSLKATFLVGNILS